MKFRVVTVGRSRCGWANEAVADYVARLRRHGGVEESVVRAETFRGDAAAVRRAESARILARVKSRDRLIVLDERGLTLDTEAFSDLVDRSRQAAPTVVFALGGAYGHDETLRRAAWRVVRLSDMVLNHEVARVVLLEQLYRAMTRISGAPYHH